MHSRTVHLPLGALLTPRTTVAHRSTRSRRRGGTGGYTYYHIWQVDKKSKKVSLGSFATPLEAAIVYTRSVLSAVEWRKDPSDGIGVEQSTT